MMTGHIKHSTGLRLGVNRVGQALKRVNPRQHHEWHTSITRHLNPFPYYAEYFEHKLHLDQNEELIRYGVTEVIPVDGYSSFITATSVMPLKNNITIYRDVFRLAPTWNIHYLPCTRHPLVLLLGKPYYVMVCLTKWEWTMGGNFI